MNAILKSVSRSFYLTIRFLPGPMREPVSLAYLLARATDTIADTAAIPAETRLTTLRELARVIAGEQDFSGIEKNLGEFAAQQSDPAERRLIENLGKAWQWLTKLEPADRADVRALLKTITRGQRLDLERFGNPGATKSLRTAAELEEYTYLVAGCVGEFWTTLGFRKMSNFATRSPEQMARLGIAYGKGLQLINVLRDRSTDLTNGRDYLPAEETGVTPLAEVFQRWLNQAEERITTGIDYCTSLTNWRVRYATALPALIGKRTIMLLRESGPDKPRMKISRNEVRRILLSALSASISASGVRKLFDRL